MLNVNADGQPIIVDINDQAVNDFQDVGARLLIEIHME